MQSQHVSLPGNDWMCRSTRPGMSFSATTSAAAVFPEMPRVLSLLMLPLPRLLLLVLLLNMLCDASVRCQLLA